MKACNKCGETKPLEEFNKNSTSKDGYRGGCRACQHVVCKAWREANKERQAATAKAWREANKERHAANFKAWREANKERYAASLNLRQERAKERWPEKFAARRAVNHSVEAGTLVKQPCEVCGNLSVEAHHDDYSKPLEVRWLCPKHHTEHHTEHTRNLNREKVA